MACNENTLREKTLLYWQNFRSDKQKRVYIPELLPRELECARERGAIIEEVLCDILVLLVGHSIEPLLQAVCTFRPREQMLLVLNEQYDAEDGKIPGVLFGETVKELIGLLPQTLINRQPYEEDDLRDEMTADQPAAIFHLLQQNLKTPLERRKDVIIDITGAKKSMVAGAFLYAAYTGTPISYVDFDDFDPRQGKPFGYTCRIRLLRDPYEAFRLRDWERVRRLYRSYQFRAAREILQGWTDPDGESYPGLIPWMRQEVDGQRYFTEEQALAVERLADVLTVYESWDNGDFKQALDKTRTLPVLARPFKSPLAVRELGSFWPYAAPETRPDQAARQLLQGLREIETGERALLGTIRHFVIYARDEIARIDRLIRFKEDYRSALLRSVGLGEPLLKARWAVLWLAGQVEVALEEKGPYTLMKDAPSEIQDWTEELTQAVLMAYRAEQLIHGLRYDSSARYCQRNSAFDCRCSRGGHEESRRFYLRRTLSAPRLEEGVLLGEIQKLRDKAIHTYLSVPKSVADEALRIARYSLEDYEGHWAPVLDPHWACKTGTEPLPRSEAVTTDPNHTALLWEEVCILCGIDFLPPDPTRKEAP